MRVTDAGRTPVWNERRRGSFGIYFTDIDLLDIDKASRWSHRSTGSWVRAPWPPHPRDLLYVDGARHRRCLSFLTFDFWLPLVAIAVRYSSTEALLARDEAVVESGGGSGRAGGAQETLPEEEFIGCIR